MVAHLKAALRKKMLAKRDILCSLDVDTLSDAITGKLISNPRFIEAKTVAFYIRKGNEVDTEKMIGHALRLGKTVLVPVTDHKITFVHFRSFTDLQPGKFGIPEPSKRETHDKEPDVVVVPGVAFGLCMHRLGYGKGYYDSYLATCPAYRIGVCYDFQVVERLPTHENDERMDEILTDKRVIAL
jgi:5-formyltetrahydrofolate cyclo-ligase